MDVRLFLSIFGSNKIETFNNIFLETDAMINIFKLNIL